MSAGQSADHVKNIIVPPRPEGRRAEIYCSATRRELLLCTAGCSANAAREIRDLITASVNRIDSGSVLANQAEETMREVTASNSLRE